MSPEFKKGDRVFVKPGMSSRYGWAPQDAATPLTVVRVEHDYRVIVRPPWDGVEYSFRPEDLTHAAPETPAPLDPAKVKAGDTVTVRVEPNPDTGWGTLDHGPEAIEVTGKVWLDSGDNPHGPVAKVGVHALGLPNVTLTDHTPAPEPEPEWKPETVALVTPHRRPDLATRAVRGTDDMWHNTYGGMWDDDEVSVRPLVVIDPPAVDVDHLVDVGSETDDPRTNTIAILTALGLGGAR